MPYHDQCAREMKARPKMCMLAICQDITSHGKYGRQGGMCPKCAAEQQLCRWCKKAAPSGMVRAEEHGGQGVKVSSDVMGMKLRVPSVHKHDLVEGHTAVARLICDECDKRIPGGKVWRCETCEFDVCKACMASELKSNDRHAHPITRKVISEGNVVICDGCDRNVLEGLPRDAHRPIRFHCAAGCDFDLCLECEATQGTPFSGTKGLAPESQVKVVNGQDRCAIVKALEADLGRVSQPQRQPLGAAPLSPTAGLELGDAEQIAAKVGKWSRYVGCGQGGTATDLTLRADMRFTQEDVEVRGPMANGPDSVPEVATGTWSSCGGSITLIFDDGGRQVSLYDDDFRGRYGFRKN